MKGISFEPQVCGYEVPEEESQRLIDSTVKEEESQRLALLSNAVRQSRHQDAYAVQVAATRCGGGESTTHPLNTGPGTE